MRRVVVWFAVLVLCCIALSEAAADAELGQTAGLERRAEEAARRNQAIRELQAHAKQGYRPGADVMEGARDGGALSLTEYMQALLGWSDSTWAMVKRIGSYGKYACYSLVALATLGVFNGLRNAIAFQKMREKEREAEEQAKREELRAKMRGEWRPSLSAAIAGTQGVGQAKQRRE